MENKRFEITETAGSVKGFYEVGAVVNTSNPMRLPSVEGVPYSDSVFTNTSSAPMAQLPESSGRKILRIRAPNPAPNTAPASSRLEGMFSMAFLSMVSMNGKTCRLITSTKPPRVKKIFSHPAAAGTSCCKSPFFCINKIQPMEAM